MTLGLLSANTNSFVEKNFPATHRAAQVNQVASIIQPEATGIPHGWLNCVKKPTKS